MSTNPTADAGPLADSPVCEPVGETLTPQQRVGLGEGCGGITSEQSLLPNADEIHAEDFPLTTPLQPGQPFAISLRPPKSQTRGSLEIWGTEEACGPVDELLWFGDMDGRLQCVELMPTRPHGRLLFVSRKLEPLRGIFTAGPGTLTLCPAGSCPGGSDGHPRAPGVELDPPEGVYEVTCRSSSSIHECSVGISGRVLLVGDEARSDERTDTFYPVGSGAFRMPSTDPYGDAWYCVGAGSNLEESSDDTRTDIRMRGVTRLPVCSGGSENASFDWRNGASSTDVASSLAGLAGSGLSIRSRCALDSCTFRFTDGTAGTSTYLYVTLDATVSGVTAATELSVRDANWFTATGGVPVRRACATAGTVQYDPSGPSTLQLDGLSAFVACPGEPVAKDAVDIVGE